MRNLSIIIYIDWSVKNLITGWPFLQGWEIRTYLWEHDTDTMRFFLPGLETVVERVSSQKKIKEYVIQCFVFVFLMGKASMPQVLWI